MGDVILLLLAQRLAGRGPKGILGGHQKGEETHWRCHTLAPNGAPLSVVRHDGQFGNLIVS